jgi:DNA-binding transcriptional ArsR family regulator
MRDVAELPSGGDADIAALGSLFADPARCKVLLALDDGRALPASVLADEAGVSRPTASSHLTKLTDAGLLSVERRGRHRYYRLAGPHVGELLEHLVRLAPPRPVRSLREGTAAARLRSARTCYDHLAGRLGVGIMGSLLNRDVLTGGDGRYDPARDAHDSLSKPGHDVRYELTDNGCTFLGELGIELPSGRRPLVKVLRRLDRAAASSRRGARPRDSGPVRNRAVGEARASRPRADGHRRRPHRAGRLVWYRDWPR